MFICDAHHHYSNLSAGIASKIQDIFGFAIEHIQHSLPSCFSFSVTSVDLFALEHVACKVNNPTQSHKKCVIPTLVHGVKRGIFTIKG